MTTLSPPPSPLPQGEGERLAAIRHIHPRSSASAPEPPGDDRIGRDHLGQHPVGRQRHQQRLDLRGKPRRRGAEPLRRRAGTRQRPLHELRDRHLAPLDHRDLVQHAEGRAEQDRLVAHQTAGAPLHVGLVVLGVAMHQRPIRREPSVSGASRCPLLNSATAPPGSIIASSRRSVSTRSIHWNERPIVTRRNRPSAGDRSKELPRTKLIARRRRTPPRRCAASPARGPWRSPRPPAGRRRRPASPGPQPRSSTRSSGARPVNRATRRISRGA